MTGVYNPLLVFLSIVVATLASYTSLELAGRIGTLSDRKSYTRWLWAGSVVMGGGIWSMHFIGMLAFTLPVSVGYDLAPTVVSVILASASSYLALRAVSRDTLSWRRLTLAGTAMGLGVAAMHYCGMEAMRMSPAIHYTPWIVAASVGIAIAASMAALWMAFHLRAAASEYAMMGRFGGALIMGLAISGMHYTGMAAANLEPDAVCLSAGGLGTHWLAMAVGGSSLALLTGTLFFLGWHTSQLERSLRDTHARLQHLGTHDALTGLPNRVSLLRHIDASTTAAARHHSQFAVLFVDLDGFKGINDALGHAAGDELLTNCAQRLVGSVRSTDMVARVGGDEFVVVVADVGDRAEVASIAAGLLASLHREIDVNGAKFRLAASIGLALYPRDGVRSDALLRHADIAMYEAKASGRNAYCFFTAEMTEKAHRNLVLQRDLVQGMERGDIYVAFLPKFTSDARQLTGAEASVYWEHPELGPVAPAEFVPVAERSGQMVRLGEWKLDAVCRWIGKWDAAGLPPIQISVNLSSAQFNAPDLVNRIDAIVGQAGIKARQIMLGVSESVAMLNTARSAEIISALQERGYQIAIDDFGAAYSSLTFLQRVRVKQLKVDRYFTSELDVSPKGGVALLQAIVTLSHALGMEVVAEGVETTSQLQRLADVGCDEVQGMLLSTPVRGADFEHFLRSGGKQPLSAMTT